MSDEKVIKKHFHDYAATWHHRLKWYPYSARYQAVKQRVEALAPASVVDVGCGTGDYCRIFDQDRTDYIGIDLSAEMIKEARHLYPGYDFRVGDGKSIDLPDGDRDLALGVALLEYYNDPTPYLRELHRIVKPGGTVIVTVPNGSNRTRALDKAFGRFAESALGRLLKRLTGRNLRPTRSAPMRTSVLHKRFTVAELEVFARPVGLHLVDYGYVNVRLFPEIVPLVHWLNVTVSKATEDRSAWRRLTRVTATIIIAQLERR